MVLPMEAAFFDLDKTVISRSSTLALSRPLYRAGMVSRGQLLRGAYAQLVYLLVGADEGKMDRLKEGMLQLTKGWDRAQVERLVEDVILDVIDPYVYAEALDLMELHRSEGRRIYIVSSSPEEVVRPLARHFGVSGVIATRAAIGPDGRYTGELEFYAYGEGKAEAVRAVAERMRIDLSRSFAYSDSVTDLPLLERRREPGRRESGQGAQEGGGGAGLADPRLPPAGADADPARLRRSRSEGQCRGRPRGGRHRRGAHLGRVAVARRRPPRRIHLVRLAPLALCLLLLPAACDGTRPAGPAARPAVGGVQPGRRGLLGDRGGGSRRRAVRGETARVCAGDVMVLYRCSPTAVPVLRISSVAGPALFLGGPFAVPVSTLPAQVRFAGHARGGTEVLIADPIPPSPSPSSSVSESPSAGRKCRRGAEPEPEPLVYVREGGVTERWLRLEGSPRACKSLRSCGSSGTRSWTGVAMTSRRRSPIGASRIDAEVGRSSSTGVALAQAAVEQDADAVVVELGTNDSSADAFRDTPRRDARHPESVPFVIWQTARGPEERLQHPGGQRGDPRRRPDLPERRDRRLGRVRARRGGADGRDPSGRGLPAARGRAPDTVAHGVARRVVEGGSDVVRTSGGA